MKTGYSRKDSFCLDFTASVFRVHSCGTNVGNFILFGFNECGPRYLSAQRKDSIHLQFKTLENWLLIDYCLCVAMDSFLFFFSLKFRFYFLVLLFLLPMYFLPPLFISLTQRFKHSFPPFLLTHYPCFQSLLSAKVSASSCALISKLILFSLTFPALTEADYSNFSFPGL